MEVCIFRVSPTPKLKTVCVKRYPNCRLEVLVLFFSGIPQVSTILPNPQPQAFNPKTLSS